MSIAFFGDGVPVNLANILSGISSNHDDKIMVATSQVPEFSQDFQNPTYAYHSLRVMQRLTITFEAPQPVFDLVCELCSIDQADDSEMAQFRRRWCIIGLDLVKHFIVIFNDTSPEALCPNGLQQSSRILSIDSHPPLINLDHHNLSASSGASSSGLSGNSPGSTLPLGANYTNHYSPNLISSENSPVPTAPTNFDSMVTQLSYHAYESTNSSLVMTAHSINSNYGYSHQLIDSSLLCGQSVYNDDTMLGLEPSTYSVTLAISIDVEHNHAQVGTLTVKDAECICNKMAYQAM